MESMDGAGSMKPHRTGRKRQVLWVPDWWMEQQTAKTFDFGLFELI